MQAWLTHDDHLLKLLARRRAAVPVGMVDGGGCEHVPTLLLEVSTELFLLAGLPLPPGLPFLGAAARETLLDSMVVLVFSLPAVILFACLILPLS